MQLEQYLPFIFIAGIALILVSALWAYQSFPRQRPKDPQRMYTKEQRQTCFTRAEYQCEMTAWLFFRCQRTAQHADHHFPHAKGGATSLANAVAACARHNTSKGAKMPTAWDTRLITWRRRSYFPPDSKRRPGQWYR